MEKPRLSPPYENPAAAYQHLLKYTEAPNIPKEPPNSPVVLFAKNNFINYRPYESFEAISRYMNSNIFFASVLVSLDHFRDAYRVLQARKMYRMITSERFASDDPRDVHEVVWNIFQSRPVTRMKAKNKNRQGNSYLFDLNKIAGTDQKFPKQCRIILSALLARERTAYTLDELKILSNDFHKFGLKTKQNPFKILQYYLPQMYDAGLVEYPRRQYVSEEGEAENE